MGRPKQLLPFGGEPLLVRAVRQALAVAELQRVLVVLGYRAGMAIDALWRAGVDDGRLAVRVNPAFRRGMGGSVALAAREALAAGAEALVLLTCDAPFLDAGAIRRVLAAWGGGAARGCPPLAVRSRAGGRPAHPVLLTRPLLVRAAALAGDRGMGPLLDRLGAGLAWVEQRPEAGLDLDTPAAYLRALQRAAAAGAGSPGDGQSPRRANSCEAR